MVKRLKNMNIRIKVYLLIIIAGIALIMWKQADVKYRRGKDIVSVISEWQQQGKPVVAHEAVRGDIKEYIKITVCPVTNRIAEVFVTRNIWEKLKAKQAIFEQTETGLISGCVAEIAHDADINNGMFMVRVAFDNDIAQKQQAIVINVHIDTFENVISLPNEIIDIVNEEFFVWKIVSGKAEKVKVTVLARNGYGAIIGSGVKEGDLIIYRGQALLKPHDKICIVSDTCQADVLKGENI